MTPFTTSPAVAVWLAHHTAEEHIREADALRRGRARRRHRTRRARRS
jgi:hypothetical protein